MFIFLKKFLLTITVRNIIIIFVVGLTSRLLVNHFLEVNVFKEYTSFISISYYLSMAGFTVFINSLPEINLKVFKISVIVEALNSVLFGTAKNGNYIVGDDYFNNNLSSKNSSTDSKLQLFTKGKDAGYSYGEQKSRHRSGGGHTTNKHSGRSHKPSINIPGAGAATYAMYDANPSKYSQNVNSANNSILYGLYDFDKNKTKLVKGQISYPYNAKGTLLSNRGSNN